MASYVLKDGNTGTSGLVVKDLAVYQKCTIQQGKYASIAEMSHIWDKFSKGNIFGWEMAV